MENPCRKCLVQPACSQLCWDKKNYGTILKNTHERHQNFFYQNPKVQKIKSMYKYYKTKQKKHLKEVVSIDTKRRDMGRAE